MDSFKDKVLGVLNNDYVLAVFAVLVTTYIAMARVYLPNFVVELFKNDVFRVVFLSLLLVYRFDKAPHVALIVALVFIVTLDYIARQEAFENFVIVKHKMVNKMGDKMVNKMEDKMVNRMEDIKADSNKQLLVAQ